MNSYIYSYLASHTFSEDCSEECDVNAYCAEEEDGDRCVCRTGFVGDGHSCLSETYIIIVMGTTVM